MIGNDIVDLNYANQTSNWRRKGFLDKVFTGYEQQLIVAATNPDQLVWLLWSMKESVYKLSLHESNERIIAPKKIVCNQIHIQEGEATGTVFYKQMFHTSSYLTDEYASTIAYATETPIPCGQNIVRFQSTDYPHQHDTIRQTIREHYSHKLSISQKDIAIRKNHQGIPALILAISSERQLAIPISLSHHGYYGAYAIEPHLSI